MDSKIQESKEFPLLNLDYQQAQGVLKAYYFKKNHGSLDVGTKQWAQSLTNKQTDI